MFDQFPEPGATPDAQPWPEQVPADLALCLRDVLSYTTCSPADVWDEVKTWLEEHTVPGPA